MKKLSFLCNRILEFRKLVLNILKLNNYVRNWIKGKGNYRR